MLFSVSPCLNSRVPLECSKSTPAVAVCSDSSNSIVWKSTVTIPSLPFFLSIRILATPSDARAWIAFCSLKQIWPGLSSSIIVTLVLVSWPTRSAPELGSYS